MNSALVNNVYDIPDELLNVIKEALRIYPNTSKGGERASHLLQGKITYQELKRLKNFFDYPSKISSKAEYELAGGEMMRDWVNALLGRERKAVEGITKSRQTNDNVVNKGTLKTQNNGLTVTINEQVQSKPIAGSAVLVLPDGRILLVKRSLDSHWEPNKWGLVGGMIKPGEEPVDGTLREIYEETGISVGRLIDRFKIEKDDVTEYVYFGVLPENAEDGIQLNDENQDFGFFEMKDIQSMDHVEYLMNYLTLALFSREFDHEMYY